MINNTQPALTVEDLFSKYLPERGTPLSADVIYWANRFGNTIEPSEEEIFRQEMLNKYGIDVAGDGGAGAPGAPGVGTGQGISSTAQSIGLGMMGYGEAFGGFAPGASIANAVGNAIAGQQADAIADSFGAMAAAPDPSTGIATVSDPEGNISTVSTPGTVAAADVATFGTADAAAPGSDVSGAADEGSHGADGNDPGTDDSPSDDSDAAAAADASDADFAGGGAVRRFDIGGNEGRAELRATPQSPFLGKVASALKSLQEMAGQYQVLPQVPLLGGTGVDELLGLPGAAREVENWSYGNYPIRVNPYAGRTASYIPEVKPGRKSDLADTVFLGMDVAPLAGLANKGVSRSARALEDATVGALQRARIRNAAAQVPEDTAYDPLRRRMEERGALMYAVKPKGGNWMEGSVDEVLSPFRLRELGGEPADRLRDIEAARAQNIEAGVPADDIWFQAERAQLMPKVAINKWIDTKLNKYMRNEMATPDDPLKALADRGVLHFSPRGIRDDSPAMTAIRGRRAMGGFPLEDTATTPLGQQWERYADYAIHTVPSHTRLAQLQLDGGASAQARLAENPWLEKLPPGTPVSSPDYVTMLNAEGVGFDHLIDELRAAVDPMSELPAHLKLDANKLDKVTMPQAVELVDKINKWRSAEAARAEKAGMVDNLKNTPRLESPDFNLSFTDKPGGVWVDLPEAIGEDGTRVCTAIGKQGGWCTKHAGNAEEYGAHNNRLVALLDADGRPHVQAQLRSDKDTMNAIDDALMFMTPKQEAAYTRYFNQFDGPPEFGDSLAWIKENAPNVYEEYLQRLADQPASPPDIIQLKPPANTFGSDRAQEYARRDPQYRAKITDAVLQFLNNGNWGKVNDLDEYNIIDLQNARQLVRELENTWGASGKDIFNAMVDTYPDTPRFMKRGEFVQRMDEFLPEGPIGNPPEGFAGGGLVKSLGKLIEKYAAKEAAKEAAVKEQKMLQGFYRGYAGDYDAARAAAQDAGVFVSPQRAVGEYYATKRAEQTGLEPHLEMILADPFVGRNYGHATRGTGKNPPMVTRARELAPEDVKERTPLYAEGGLVDYDPDEIAQIAERATQGFAAGGLVHYDPNEIDTIVSQLKEEFHA